jgi:hypothetical protein
VNGGWARGTSIGLMASKANPAPGAAVPPAAPRLALAEVLLLLLVFFVHAGWPVPEVNETHYLAKARHYWDRNWCAGDFFLETADAHQVFYWTLGWWTRWLPLPVMAWCGRLTVWLLLAWSWRRFSWQLVPRPLAAVLSGALMIALLERCQMAGEWLVGGVEAKGFAYALVLCGFAALLAERWRSAWLWLGAAVAFHAVVGCWAALAAAVAWLGRGPGRPTLASQWPGLMGGAILALPGLVSAAALSAGVDAATARLAAEIYVFERLPHHLVPQEFGTVAWFGVPVPFVARHAALVAVWLVLAAGGPPGPRWRMLRAVVGTAVGLAVCGGGLSLLQYVDRGWAAAALRFYWFRLSDVLVPWGVALEVTARAATAERRPPWRVVLWLVAGMLVAGLHLGQTALAGLRQAFPKADTKLVDAHSWRDTCAWVAAHTPADARFLTPRMAQSFRWYAQRAEVVSQKDLPQDARSIVQWWARLQDIHRAGTHAYPSPWHGSLTELTAARLRQLGVRYGAAYLVTEAEPPLPLERIDPAGGSYAVYRLMGPAGHDRAN